jgi:hypothetical protein
VIKSWPRRALCKIGTRKEQKSNHKGEYKTQPNKLLLGKKRICYYFVLFLPQISRIETRKKAKTKTKIPRPVWTLPFMEASEIVEISERFS